MDSGFHWCGPPCMPKQWVNIITFTRKCIVAALLLRRTISFSLIFSVALLLTICILTINFYRKRYIFSMLSTMRMKWWSRALELFVYCVVDVLFGCFDLYSSQFWLCLCIVSIENCVRCTIVYDEDAYENKSKLVCQFEKWKWFGDMQKLLINLSVFESSWFCDIIVEYWQ